MMIIPGLRDQPPSMLGATVARLQTVFTHYADTVVFVDLNVRLNLLWVSVKPIPGICLALPAAIQAWVPDARLVAERYQA